MCTFCSNTVPETAIELQYSEIRNEFTSPTNITDLSIVYRKVPSGMFPIGELGFSPDRSGSYSGCTGLPFMPLMISKRHDCPILSPGGDEIILGTNQWMLLYNLNSDVNKLIKSIPHIEDFKWRYGADSTMVISYSTVPKKLMDHYPRFPDKKLFNINAFEVLRICYASGEELESLLHNFAFSKIERLDDDERIILCDMVEAKIKLEKDSNMKDEAPVGLIIDSLSSTHKNNDAESQKYYSPTPIVTIGSGGVVTSSGPINNISEVATAETGEVATARDNIIKIIDRELEQLSIIQIVNVLDNIIKLKIK